MKNSLSPQGNQNIPFNPVALAITMGAPFVARGFAGERDHLKELIKEAILFKSTALMEEDITAQLNMRCVMMS